MSGIYNNKYRSKDHNTFVTSTPIRDSSPAATPREDDDRSSQMSIAILVDAHLNQFDPVRKPNLAFLERMTDRLSTKLFHREKDIRGHMVAAASLIDAFIRHINSTRRQLFVYPEARAAIAARLGQLQSDEQKRGQVTISSIFEALEAVDKYQILAWFNPIPNCRMHGGIEISHRIRSRSTSKPFPITTLLHGLAEQTLVYSIYLKFLLEPTLPCDSIICTSRAARDAAQKILDHLSDRLNSQFNARAKFNGRFDLIPLCVDTSEFRPRDKSSVRAKLKLPQDAFLIIYLGKIALTKGDLCPFLHAFRALVKSNPQRRLLWIIAGTESQGYSEVLLKCASELGVAEYIKVLLNISDETKSLLLSASDVFISPVDTLNESFGLSPIEAMACGVPQVVPDWNGYRDTVSHGETGFLTPTYWTSCCSDLTDTGNQFDGAFNRLCLGQSIAVDMKETIRYIQIIIDNSTLHSELAQRSRQRALSFYSFEPVVKQYEELWTELARMAQLQPAKASISLERLHYYDLFGHYASAPLVDETTLRLTQLGNEAMALDLPLPPNSLPPLDFRVLDAGILRRALAVVMNHSDNGEHRWAQQRNAQGQRQMGELIRVLSRECGYNPDYLRRHLMWLIKYSYLEPIMK